MAELLARKSWSNASAFIEMNVETGDVRVYGKFYSYDGYRRVSCDGPRTNWFKRVPQELMDEAKKVSWCDEKSQELEDFCNEVWQEAKQLEPWFEY